MATQNSTVRGINLVLGTAIAAFGLGILSAQPEGPAGCLTSLLCSAANGLVELLPSLFRIVFQFLGGSVCDHLVAFGSPLHVFVSWVPLLKVFAGAA